MPAAKPVSIRLMAYQVGFGDSFLLTFRYPREERHVLIDFGTTHLPDGAPRAAAHMQQVATDIAERCRGAPFAIVATHRHADHISGFSTEKPKHAKRSSAGFRTSGDIIRALSPRVVVQPWTEDPRLPTGASGPRAARAVSNRGFRSLLGVMAKISEAAVREGDTLRAALKSGSYHASVARELRFLGENNLSNASAVRNLMAMGRAGRAVYAYYGSRSGLESFLPGVDVHVLGPPTVVQSSAVKSQRKTDPDEFWHLRNRLHAYWREQARMLVGANVAAAVRKPRAGARAGRGPFPSAPVFDPRAVPPELRWFRNRALVARGEQLLELVRAMDDVLNNTSLILLFRIGPLKLLFPGDAQIENWSYALTGRDAKRNRELLGGVDLYKVGHHGSLNATPRTLWGLFEKKGPQKALRTIVSTLEDVHGHEEKRTEVPRRTLVAALRSNSTYFTTQSLRGELSRLVEIELTGNRPRFSAWKAIVP
ncbi:MAG TPA: hypothetical protein VFL83_04640 [Anaeromyxobacter sp.]|nr:hypothetical protein [Anaeromyxobacter sp.]